MGFAGMCVALRAAIAATAWRDDLFFHAGARNPMPPLRLPATGSTERPPSAGPYLSVPFSEIGIHRL